MLRYLLIITLLLLTFSCGGGKKNSNGASPSPSPVDTNKKFEIGGVVKGLSGNLAIANGDDTITIGADGRFVFVKPVSEGALYNVKIVALPPNQLCELRNSKNYAYRHHYDIGIECANLVEKNIRLSLPSNIKLDEVRLLSNYHAKGGQGEEQITDTVTKMMVFDNSVVSLRNADNQILLLAYLGNLTADEFELSSKSTAIALMLLEPSVVSALQDRGLVIGEVADQLVTLVNASGHIDLLAGEIQNLIINNGNLHSPHSMTSLSPALGRVLDSAVRVIANRSALPPKQPNAVAATSTAVRQKLSTVNSSDALGVAFQYVKATSGALNVSTSNQSARYVSLHSDKFSAFTLAPLSNQSFALESGLASQENFNVFINGPGVLGNVSDTNMTNVLEAGIASGLNQYFLPSLNVLLGLKNPSSFKTSDCLADSSIKSLDTKTETQINVFKDLINNDKYYKLLTNVSHTARSQFLSSKNAANQTPVVELFACEKFGIGVLIANKKSIAIENTTGILTVLNAVFDSAKLPASLNLLSVPNVSYLSDAIRNSYAERIWVLSSALQFEINASRTQVFAGSNVEFTSSCKDPNTNMVIDCNVTWDFGDGSTATGNAVAHTYLTNGLYQIKATAKDADGAQQTQTANIAVIIFSKEDNAVAQWVVTHGGTEQPLNSVRANTLYDENTDTLQLRFFVSPQSDNPQIRLKLNGYNFNATGEVKYLLGDTVSGETCLGFYADEAVPESKLYCTSTTGRTSTHPFTGTVTVSPGLTIGSKKAAFEFDAFDLTCTTDIATCDSIHVSGEVQFDLGF